jgi:hypothetical protein
VLEGPEIETHHHRTGHRWFDLIIGGTAVFLSCISVFIAVHHGQTMEKLVEANSWPSLSVTSSNVNEAGTADDITFDLANNGVGLARVDTLQIFYKGVRQTSFPELLKTCCDTKGQKISYAYSSIVDQVVPARTTIHFVRLPHATSPALWDAFNKARTQVNVLTCYCSVFEECWISDTRARRPERVTQCTQPVADNFQLD